MLHAAKRMQCLALGLLILWQLVYLAIANSLETLEIVTHRFPETSAAITKILDESRAGEPQRPLGSLSSLIYVVDKYGQFTEQPQRWSLFAPNISDQTSFLAYELRWHGEEQSAWLLSDNEPENPAEYWRMLGNRVRSVEQNLTVSFSFDAGETEQEARERWAGQIRDKLARDHDILIAHAALRLLEFQADHPDAPVPDEVLIHIRGYQIAPPGADAAGQAFTPYQLAFARWRPTASYSPEVIPVEAFDPVTEQYVFQPWANEVQP